MATRFTIAIPTHNRRETVLLAVRSALAQTRPPEQIIVLCDGCDDGTAEAVRSLGSPLADAIELPKAPGYAYGHRNRSLELARGEVIVWLADDDLLTPNHLELIGALWDRGQFELVQCDAALVYPDDALGWFCGDWSIPQGRARLAITNTNPMAAVSVRVDVARAAGGWDVTVPQAADWDLWRRVVDRGARTARSPEPTVLHFRATGRQQPWAERVRQNTAWLERICDPARSAELRDMLVGARSLWEEHILEELTATHSVVAGQRTELAAVHNEFARVHKELVTVHEQLAMLGEQSATLRHALMTAEVQAAAHAETLNRIYAGRWWRLRGRVAPVLRVYRRLRAVSSRL